MYHFVEPFKRFLAALEAQYLPLDKRQKYRNSKRQRQERNFKIVMSGQFCTLAMFLLLDCKHKYGPLAEQTCVKKKKLKSAKTFPVALVKAEASSKVVFTTDFAGVFSLVAKHNSLINRTLRLALIGYNCKMTSIVFKSNIRCLNTVLPHRTPVTGEKMLRDNPFS